MRIVLKRNQSFSAYEIEEALIEWLSKKDIPAPSASALDRKFTLSSTGAELSWTEDFER